MTINISNNHTITCPICGKQAHGLIVKGSYTAELVGCDACLPDLAVRISKNPSNIYGPGYEYYPVERDSPYAPDDYSLSTPYDAVLERGDYLDRCPICGKPCSTIIIEDCMPIGCSHCAPGEEAQDDYAPDYGDLEAMYADGIHNPCRVDTETYNRWATAKHREWEIVTGKAGRPLISGWDRDGQGNLYDI